MKTKEKTSRVKSINAFNSEKNVVGNYYFIEFDNGESGNIYISSNIDVDKLKNKEFNYTKSTNVETGDELIVLV